MSVPTRAVKTADAKIDRLVYDLYDLTEEEIKVVEWAAVKNDSLPLAF